MSAGFFGLGGVLLGGLITVGWQWLTEKRQRDARLRHVAMALNEELLWLDAGLVRVLSGHSNLDGLDREVSALQALWQENQETVAYFDTKTWGATRMALRLSERLLAHAAERPPGAMIDLEGVWVKTVRSANNLARKYLAAQAGTNPPSPVSAERAAAAYAEMIDGLSG
jgi:hypothetical protein